MKFIGKSAPYQSMAKRYIQNENLNLNSNFFKGNPDKFLIMKRSPQISFTKTKRNWQNEQYQKIKFKSQKRQKKDEIFQSQKKQRQKGMKFQESQRIDFQKTNKDFPGPACYSKKNVLFKTMPSVSFKYKHDQQSFFNQKENVVSPDHYNPKFDFWQKGVKFNKQKKKVLLEKQNQQQIVQEKFQHKKKITLRSTFGRATKKVNEQIKKNDQPGPGYYLGNIDISNDIVKINKEEPKKKVQKKQQQDEPGPASYYLENKYSNFFKKGIKFFHQKRFKSVQIDDEKSDINPNKIATQRREKGIIIYKQKYEEEKDRQFPGPGKYNIKHPSKQKISYKFKRHKKVISEKKQKLGPGSYDIDMKYKRNSQRVIFNKAKLKEKLKIDQRKMANLCRKFGQNKMTFGKSKRFKECEQNQIGPASYNIQETIPNNQPWLKNPKNRVIIQLQQKMKKFKIGVCQIKTTTNKILNLKSAQKLLQKCKENQADVCVLGENFNCPFGSIQNQNYPEIFEDYSAQFQIEDILKDNENPTVKFLQQISKDLQIFLISGSIPIKKNNKIYNTTLVYDNGKFVDKYEKLHCFDVTIPGKVNMKESSYITPGNKIKVLQTKFGNFGLGICYDLRFCNFAMAMRKLKADILFYPSVFTETTGKMHFEKLGIARALDTQCHVVLASNAKSEEKEVNSSYGHSQVINHNGKVLQSLQQEESFFVQEIDLEIQNQMRQQLPFTTYQQRNDIYSLNILNQQC